MFVYVISKNGSPLMPCKPAIARLLLKEEKAKVKTRMPFTIKLINPDVNNWEYQDGKQKGYYNLKAYILDRDGYRCQCHRGKNCESKKGGVLQVHHIAFRSEGGTNTPANLITLGKKCHTSLHAGKFKLKAKKSTTKHATEMGIVKSQLKKQWNFVETFGYETKFKREQVLQLLKTHANDAIAICYEEGELVNPDNNIFHKKHVSAGDYQQTKGVRSQMRIPTGKLFGFRKHDYIKTSKGLGFVKGKRSSGFFALSDIHGKTLTASVSVKKNAVRIIARSTTLIQQHKEDVLSSPA